MVGPRHQLLAENEADAALCLLDVRWDTYVRDALGWAKYRRVNHSLGLKANRRPTSRKFSRFSLPMDRKDFTGV